MQNDDDWVSVEEEKKDYSGLKIGTLKIEDKDKAEPEEEHEINDEGRGCPSRRLETSGLRRGMSKMHPQVQKFLR